MKKKTTKEAQRHHDKIWLLRASHGKFICLYAEKKITTTERFGREMVQWQQVVNIINWCYCVLLKTLTLGLAQSRWQCLVARQRLLIGCHFVVAHSWMLLKENSWRTKSDSCMKNVMHCFLGQPFSNYTKFYVLDCVGVSVEQRVIS